MLCISQTPAMLLHVDLWYKQLHTTHEAAQLEKQYLCANFGIPDEATNAEATQRLQSCHLKRHSFTAKAESLQGHGQLRCFRGKLKRSHVLCT
jgi:hypothetical protein